MSGLAPKADMLSLPPPAFRERRHRGLARRPIAVRRCAILVMPERKRPHPRRIHRRCIGTHDPADDCAVDEHVEVVIAPLAGWARGGGAFEDERHDFIRRSADYSDTM